MSADNPTQQKLEPCPLPEPLRTLAQEYCFHCRTGTVINGYGAQKVLSPHRGSTDPRDTEDGITWWHRLASSGTGYGCSASALYEMNSRAPVVAPQIYADGYCARCSELAYPLTRALEATGVPTGADNWQQTYGPNKVRALADFESELRRLLLAFDEEKPEDVKSRIEWAKFRIEFHAAVRRRLTALAQGREPEPGPASSPASSPEHYFIVTQTRDKCGYSGCELGPLDHPEVPKHNFPAAATPTPVEQEQRAHYESAHEARYVMTHAVHPDIVVLWFLALKSHWFDDPNNMFHGMREQAKAYLYKWVETGELADDNTTLEIATAMKFREWLKSSWTTATPSPSLAAREAAEEIAALEKPNHSNGFIEAAQCDICTAYRQRIVAIIERHRSPDEDRMRWLLTRIIHDLPERRDWLDPDLEREARTYMK